MWWTCPGRKLPTPGPPEPTGPGGPCRARESAWKCLAPSHLWATPGIPQGGAIPPRWPCRRLDEIPVPGAAPAKRFWSPGQGPDRSRLAAAQNPNLSLPAIFTPAIGRRICARRPPFFPFARFPRRAFLCAAPTFPRLPLRGGSLTAKRCDSVQWPGGRFQAGSVAVPGFPALAKSGNALIPDGSLRLLLYADSLILNVWEFSTCLCGGRICCDSFLRSYILLFFALSSV